MDSIVRHDPIKIDSLGITIEFENVNSCYVDENGDEQPGILVIIKGVEVVDENGTEVALRPVCYTHNYMQENWR
jgi:hypothetical protein